MILIGIDPGVHTGFAIVNNRHLTDVLCMPACEAEAKVLDWHKWYPNLLMVYFEDARMRNWFGNKGREALQGAGSIKRDCQRWEEWLKYYNVPHVAVAPRNNKTKLDAAQFRRITGWEGRTNEHSRDAGMLIFNRP
jgi:hypothetical protein